MEMIDHGFAADAREATKIAFMAGVDMSMTSGFYRDHLPDLVEKGEVRWRGSMNRYARCWRSRPSSACSRTRDAGAFARDGEEVDRLLKNEGDVLPLRKGGQKIAIIGPFAAGQHDLNGPWCVYGDNKLAIDLETGVRNALGKNAQITVVEGSQVEAPLPGGIEAAVAAARNADVVLLAIGAGRGRGRDRQAVIVVLKNGRALALEGAVKNAPAILVTWFLGSESGNAIADVLFGDTAPRALADELPARAGPAALLLFAQAHGRPNPSDDKLEDTRPTIARSRTRRSTRSVHGLTYGKIDYANLTPDKGTLAWDGGDRLHRDDHQPRHPRGGGSGSALHPRSRREHHPPGPRAQGVRKIALAPGASGNGALVLKRAQLEFIGRDLKAYGRAGPVRRLDRAVGSGAGGSFDLHAYRLIETLSRPCGRGSGTAFPLPPGRCRTAFGASLLPQILTIRVCSPRPSGFSAISTHDSARKPSGTSAIVIRIADSVARSGRHWRHSPRARPQADDRRRDPDRHALQQRRHPEHGALDAQPGALLAIFDRVGQHRPEDEVESDNHRLHAIR
ncbi:periplasmic beta-glucosidase [Ditylenchus destructor]|uniref:beta-glucosidase n=1 Tax=Ditylenchus destructor TaxID=166010 RepID=A0AAD4MI45_9BILA|nr:periplasmic beta-glucosidase [Ditylenchus destructor]